MDVKLPNGKVIKGVPAGTSKTEVMRKAVNAGLATYQDFGEAIDPTADMSTGQKLAAGAGKAVFDIGRGIGQRLGIVSESDVAASRGRDSALMATTAGKVGNVAGNVATLAPFSFIPGVNTMAGAAALGGASGLAVPTTEGESVLGNVALGAAGGAAGQGLANTVGRMVRPVQTTLPPSSAPLAEAAQNAGIQLNAAQRTGSKPLAVLDSVLDYMPFTGDKQAALKGAQRQAWQRAVMRELGENADEVTPGVLNSARERIGAQFNDIAKRNVVKIDDMFLDTLATAESKLTNFSSPNAKKAINRALDLAAKAEKSGGVIPGREYQTIRSALTKAADDAFGARNSELGQTLQTIRDGLDDAAEASISPDDAAAWVKARSQWKLLKRVEKAADNASGNLSPKKFYNEMTRKDSGAMIYGRGNQTLPNLARVGKEFIAENVPNSGTAQRQMWQNLLTGGGGALGMGVLGGMVPPAAMLGAAASAATPLAAQRLLWSGGDYLTRGLLPNFPSQAAGLLRRGAIAGGAALPLIANSSE